MKKALVLMSMVAVVQVPLPGAESPYPSPADLNIRIVGTASFRGQDTALIQDANTQSDSFYRVGDPIYGYKITDISLRGVTVEKFGSKYFVEFQGLPATSAPPSSTALAKPKPNMYLTDPEKALASVPESSKLSPNFYLEGTKSTQWDIWSGKRPSGRQAADVGGRFAMPLSNYKRLSSQFGYRKHPLGGGRKMHEGLDFAARKGTKIYAADSGRVTFSGYRGGYGYCIIVDHQNGYSTLYGHCSKLVADVGDNVRRGDYIGQVGSTGASTGPHLHFEVRQQGKPINPAQFFKDV